MSPRSSARPPCFTPPSPRSIASARTNRRRAITPRSSPRPPPPSSASPAARRALLASLRDEYTACLYLILRVHPPKPSAAQAQLEQQFRRKEDEEDFERRQREEADALERLHLLQLKQQQGEPVDPTEFSPAPK